LCAKRLEKCSIEGGLVRSPSFQRKLLAHEVDYQRKDPKASFGDTDTMDGFSFNVLFGKYRHDLQVDNDTDAYYGERYVVTHTGTFRVRFDLLYSDEHERHLSHKWMLRFADELGRLQCSNLTSHLNFSYHTSLTLKYEIEKYSKPDAKLIMSFMAVFWSVLALSMWLNCSSGGRSKRRPGELDDSSSRSMDAVPRSRPTIHNRYSGSDDSLHTQPLTASSARCCSLTRLLNQVSCRGVRLRLLACCTSCCSAVVSLCSRLHLGRCFKPRSVCINGAGFLPLCLLVQFVLTIVATYGLIALLNIETNPMTFTVVFIIMSKIAKFS
jgi:hypothetical protein